VQKNPYSFSYQCERGLSLLDVLVSSQQLNLDSTRGLLLLTASELQLKKNCSLWTENNRNEIQNSNVEHYR